VLHGSAEQIAAVDEDEELQRDTVDASLVVNNLRHVDGAWARLLERLVGG